MQLLNLPLHILIKTLVKMNTNTKDLLKLRQCNSTINEIVEEYRFAIAKRSKMSASASITIIYRLTDFHFYDRKLEEIEQPYSQLSALSFKSVCIQLRGSSFISVDPKVQKRLAALLKKLKLFTQTLHIEGINKPPTEDANLGLLINFRHLSCNFDSATNIFSTNVLKKPCDFLTMDFDYQDYSVENAFEAIRTKNIYVDIRFGYQSDFALDTVRYLITKLSDSSYPRFPTLSILWSGQVPSEFLEDEMQLVFLKDPNVEDLFVECIYAKALFSKFLMITQRIDNCVVRGMPYFHVKLIEKTKEELGEYLNRRTEKAIDGKLLDYIFNALTQ